jgi:hypothetical protein
MAKVALYTANSGVGKTGRFHGFIEVEIFS